MRYLLFLALFVFLSFSSLAEVQADKSTEEQEKKSAEEQNRTVAEEHEDAEEQKSDEEVEKLEVLGSHIKKISTEGPSPVLVIDREQIEMSGYNSLGAVLRDLPVASFGGQRAASLRDIPSSTGTSLRGMKSNNILILINGARVSPIGGGSAVDLNIIPLSVIERIEILKEGTPLYGSDAIGGVINVVTKSDYAGGEVNVHGSLVQRVEGNSWEGFASLVDFWNWDETGHSTVDNSWAGKADTLSVDASYGGSKSDINYIVGGQVRLDTSIYMRDRSFGQPLVKHYSPTGSPGSWKEVDSSWNPAPGCPEENVEKGRCKFDFSSFMSFMPQIFQTSGFFQASTDIDDMMISGRVIYNYTRAHSVLAPAPDGMRVPMELAQKMGLPADKDVDLAYRLVGEEGTGPREGMTNQHFYQVQFGAIKPFLNTLELELELNISGAHYFHTGKGYAIKKAPNPNDGEGNKSIEEEALQLMKDEGKTNLDDLAKQDKFNPIADKKNDVSKATYEPFSNTHSNVISLEPKLTGEIMEIGEQSSLLFAMGAVAAWQRYDQNSDVISKAGVQWGGGVVSEGSGDRLSSGFYGELSSILAEMIEVQIGARTDYYYSDVGFSGFAMQDMFDGDLTLPFSPRAALSFQPINEIKFRTSWGMGFKAPTLMSLNHDEVIGHPFTIDYVQCPSYDRQNPECNKKQVEAKFTSSDELKPELSQSFNVGVVVEPTQGISFGLDYYRTTQEDIIINFSDADSLNEFTRNVIKYEQKYGVEKLRNLGKYNVKRSPTGEVETVEVQATNLANYEAQGLDFEFTLTMPLEAGWDLGFSVQHSHLLYVEQQVFEGLDAELPVPYYEWIDDSAGTEETWYGFPRWRNRAILSVMNKDMGHSAQLIVHNIPGQLKLPESKEKTEYYWQLDLAGTVGLTKSTRLTLGIRNILGQERPDNKEDFTAGGGYIHSSLYSIRGRTIDARLTYNFQ